MARSTQTLTSYVPPFVVRYLERGPAVSKDATGERWPAALLFADISGFSHLVEEFAQDGAAGAEEISLALNAYFTTLINLISACGGEVVHFAGDGLIALWPASTSGGGLSAAVC